MHSSEAARKAPGFTDSQAPASAIVKRAAGALLLCAAILAAVRLIALVYPWLPITTPEASTAMLAAALLGLAVLVLQGVRYPAGAGPVALTVYGCSVALLIAWAAVGRGRASEAWIAAPLILSAAYAEEVIYRVLLPERLRLLLSLSFPHYASLGLAVILSQWTFGLSHTASVTSAGVSHLLWLPAGGTALYLVVRGAGVLPAALLHGAWNVALSI